MFQRPTLEPGQAINILQWTRYPGPVETPRLLIVGARLGEGLHPHTYALAFK